MKTMSEHKPIIVQFPLRGEWLAPNTPGTKIPSHGTNQLGATYAYDFIQVDWKRAGRPAYKGTLLHYLLRGIPIDHYYSWGQNIYAPCDGVVVQAKDGCRERERTNLRLDLFHAYQHARAMGSIQNDIPSVAGNYIMLKCEKNVVAALCHLQTGSVQVAVGQHVKKGEVIGRVGHSGNSFAPHLHFQLMDSCDVATAKGLPCAFEQYERFHNNQWHNVLNGIPTNTDRIRFNH